MAVKTFLNTALKISLFLVVLNFSAAAHPKIIYVDDDAAGENDGSSWTDAFNFLQDALVTAHYGDEIRVAQGVYKPNGGMYGDDEFKLITGVAIKGGYAGWGKPDSNARDINLYKTILSGDLNGDDVEVIDPGDLWSEPTRADNVPVFWNDACDETAVLDGFIITAGRSLNGGGGMINHYGSPTIINCIFSANTAGKDGLEGGGAIYNYYGNPVLINCEFIGNSAGDSCGGGGMYNDYSNPTLINCTFIGNTVEYCGGGMINFWSNPILMGCTFTDNFSPYRGGGIHNDSGSFKPVLTNCTFIRNRSDGDGGGMYGSRTNSPVLTNCTFMGNSAQECGGAICNGASGDGGGGPTINNCMFTGNRAGDNGGAVHNGPHSNTILTRCTFSDNSASNGNALACNSLYQKYPSDLEITNCVIWDGGNEIWNNDNSAIKITYTNIQSGWTGQGNIDTDPCFVEPGYWDPNGVWIDGDYHLLRDSPCINAGDPNYIPEPNETDLDGNPRVICGRIDMGVYEFQSHLILYVDTDATGANDGSSWTDAYYYLQDALAAAWSGDEIRVAQGVYKPDQGAGITPGDREATFQLINGVIIKGGYAGFGEPDPDARYIDAYETFLSGDLNGNDVGDPYDPSKNDNCYHVVTGSGTDGTAVLDGFIITAGKAYGPFDHEHGGGMYNVSGSPTLTWCSFVRNWSASHGGGIYNVSGNPTLTYCTFSRNTAGSRGGGGMYNSGSPTLTNCTFYGNKAIYGSGGGIYSSSGSPMLINCIFSGNFGGRETGAGIDEGGGGMYNYSSSPTLINCIFSGNESVKNRGGAMRNFGSSSPTLVNCTLSGNSSKNNGGGIYNDSGSPVLTNCILWGNVDKEGLDESAQIHGGEPVVSCSCIQGLDTFAGNGNLGDDPLFMDADGADSVIGTEDDNLRLWPWSACADAGDSSALPPSVVTDLEGEPRIANGIVDMGAYEGPKQGFVLSTQHIIIPEGATTTFTVALAIDPVATVEVIVGRESGDPDITVESGGSLTFDSSNYSVPRVVTLAAAEDFDTITGSTLIMVRARGLVAFGLTATEEDNEPYPNVLVVDDGAPGANNGSTWQDAFNDLQDAMSFAAMHPEIVQIRVAQGVYRPAEPNGDRTAAFELLNDVTIKGGYAGFGEPEPDARDVRTYETILSGDLNGNDGPNFAGNGENSYHVVIGSQTDSMGKTTEALDGFTITGGNADAPYHPDKRGGGMYCNSEASVSNCLFTANFADYGGGIYCGPSWCCVTCPTLTNCTFIGNSAGENGGGIWVGDSDPTLTNCRISGNSAGRHGGGLMFGNDNFTTMVNCLINGNSAGGNGGGIYGIFCFRWTMNNCTLTDNSAAGQGGGIHNDDGSDMTLTNCILWGDSPEEISGQWTDWITLSHCCVKGGWPGEANLDADPLFVNAAEDDYHLLLDSPCIDTGDNVVVRPDTNDLDGNTRIIDGDNDGVPVVDMGAFEYRLTISAEAGIVPRTINLASKGNRITCYIRLQEQYNVADIEPNSIFLDGQIQPEQFSVDEHKQIAMAIFNRKDVQAVLEAGEINLKITGQLTDGTAFEATDTIKVINKIARKAPN